jgi:hypothetical protein
MDRSIRAWTVASRLAESLPERAQALMGILQNRWGILQSVPPACGLLQKQPRDAAFVEQLRAAHALANELVQSDALAALWARGIDPWGAFTFLGKVRWFLRISCPSALAAAMLLICMHRRRPFCMAALHIHCLSSPCFIVQSYVRQ